MDTPAEKPMKFDDWDKWKVHAANVETIYAKLDTQLRHSEAFESHSNLMLYKMKGLGAFSDYMGGTRQCILDVATGPFPMTVEHMNELRARLAMAPIALRRTLSGVAPIGFTAEERLDITRNVGELLDELHELTVLARNALYAWCETPAASTKTGQVMVERLEREMSAAGAER